MLTWIIERHLNGAAERLAKAAEAAGAPVVRWDGDDDRGLPPAGTPAVFQGSLQGYARFADRWEPGPIGDPEALTCRAWLPTLGALALNQQVVVARAGELNPSAVPWPRVFVRPDSALKPFAGRVLDRGALSPSAVDLGFYFEDPDLVVLLSPAVEVLAEWRFVAVDRRVVAQSGYVAEGRDAREGVVPVEAMALATQAATRSPARAVVIDVCQTPERFAVVEYNLFSGADLYGCDSAAIVDACQVAFGSGAR